MPNKNSLKNLEKGAASRWVKGDPRAKAGQLKGTETKRRKAAAKQIFTEVLGSIPQMDSKTRNTLAALGITSTDAVDIQTIIAVAMAQKGMKGDVKAATLAFEMSGETALARLQEERLKLEKERLQLERERLLLEQKTTETVQVAEMNDPFVQALKQYALGITSAKADIPEGVEPESGE